MYSEGGGGGRWIPVPLTCSGKRLDFQPFYRDGKKRYNLPGGDLSWFFGQIAENKSGECDEGYSTSYRKEPDSWPEGPAREVSRERKDNPQ